MGSLKILTEKSGLRFPLKISDISDLVKKWIGYMTNRTAKLTIKTPSHFKTQLFQAKWVNEWEKNLQGLRKEKKKMARPNEKTALHFETLSPPL